MEFFSVVFAFFLLFLPGIFVANRLKMKNWQEWVPFSIVFSLILFGIAVYSISFFTPITHLFFIFYLIFFLALVWRDWHSKKIILMMPSYFFSFSTLVPLLIFAAYVLLLTLTVVQFSPTAFDSLSYHQTFIHWMQDRQQFSYFESPQNVLEYRANGFPKLYEAIIGGISIISPLIGSLIPIFVLFGSALLIHAFSTRIRLENYFSIFLYIFSPLLFTQFVTDYVDAFLALVFLSVFYLLTVKHHEQHVIFWLGLGVGVLFSIKVTAIVLIPALVLISLLYYFRFIVFHLKKLLLGVAIGVFPIAFQWASYPPSRFSLGLGPVSASTTNLATSTNFIQNIFFSLPIESIYFIFSAFLAGFIGIFLYNRIMQKFASGVSSERLNFLLVWGVCALFLFFSFLILGFANSFSFMRYILAFYGLVCILGGAGLTFLLKNYFLSYQKIFTILFIILISIPGMSISFSYYEQRAAGADNFSLVLRELQVIPSDAHVFFVNTPNPIVYGVRYQKISDFSSVDDLGNISCAFLRERGVSHVVIFYPSLLRDLGEANESIRQEIVRGNCGTIVSDFDGWMQIYSLYSEI